MPVGLVNPRVNACAGPLGTVNGRALLPEEMQRLVQLSLHPSSALHMRGASGLGIRQLELQPNSA